MDFTVDSEQRALQQSVREMSSRVAPSQTAVGPGTYEPKAWSAMADLGLLALPFAEEVGGAGASAAEVVLASAELGRARLRSPYAESLAATRILIDAGGEPQASLVADVVAGERLVVTAFAEPGRAWAPEAPTVTAAEGADGWTLTGAKGPVPYGEAAYALVVNAATPHGPGLFLVEEPTVVDGMVVFEATPATVLDAGATEGALAAGLDLGLAALCGEALGAMEAALGLTVDYLKARKQFGVPLMTFQTLTQRAADMYVSVELARSAVLFAGMAVTDSPDADAAMSRVKVLVGRTGRHVAQESIQLHGGIGVTAEYAVGHHATRLTEIEHTFGDTRYHLAPLAGGLAGHTEVDVFA